ncbi:DoxX family protein [Haloprofundus sp. MHR1]|uniref:DoxX family protein n=1 Tax=Haloprofundus sp. MHR1 TaxID=2572921 RepID=UPI0010BE7F1D|nr:DoxX family protein [Haloprofundus sp. MHR1]QCJ46585.1 DoxX family protein [Haloprofundus sp. MHR1]
MRRHTLQAAFATAALLLSPGVASAHVKYVVDGGGAGNAVRLLATVASDPLSLALILGTGGGVVVAAAGYLRYRPAGDDIRAFRAVMDDYRDLLPWLLRLSVGLPLVGAGFAGYFFTPLVPAPTRLFGVAVGFLLLFGLATRLAAVVGLVGYLVGLAFRPELFLAFEYVPAFLAIVLVGGGRPSADQLIARMADDDRTLYSRVDPFYRRVAVPFERRIAPYRPFVPTILRVGMGLSFVYLGVAQKLMNPVEALAVVEKYDLTAVVPVLPELWVVGAGLAEAVVGLALLFGAFTRASSLVAFGLFTTTLFGLPDDPVLAHISLFGLVSALLVTGGGPFSFDAWMARETRSERTSPRTETGGD